MSGLSFEKALETYRGMSAPEQAALVDKKKALSPAMLAALMAATPPVPMPINGKRVWRRRGP